MSQKHEDICVSYECSLKCDSEEKDFNNQVDRMTCSVDTSQPLSPATPVITQWAYEQSGRGGRDGGYALAQQHRLPPTKAGLGYSPC